MRLTLLFLFFAVFGFGQTPVRGRVNLDQDKKPHPVRNDVAQPNDEVVTLRYFRIKSGSYDEFYKASVEGVWPYFEKLGSRIIGMWKVVEPDGIDGLVKAKKDYDEVYMTTRYANMEHWKASREGVQHGGNGPDWDKCEKALRFRNGVTLQSSVIFMKGHMAPNGPYFMPGMKESYESKP